MKKILLLLITLYSTSLYIRANGSEPLTGYFIDSQYQGFTTKPAPIFRAPLIKGHSNTIQVISSAFLLAPTIRVTC